MSHLYKRILTRGCRKLRGGTLTMRFWDGTSRHFGRGEPKMTLTLKTPAVVPRLLLDPELAFGEAYMRGELEFEGRLEDLIQLIAANEAPLPRVVETMFHGAALLSRARPLSMAKNRRDVAHHYDLGNDFYEKWLDATMTYSCAYFRAADDTLEMAQRQKIAHILRKLQLKSEETLLDVGCGWGGLLESAARDYGISGLGITLSDQQLAWFEAHHAPNLPVRVELKHYHALAQSGVKFDKIVTVGMAEHVGRHALTGYISDLKSLLKPGGLGLLHCITNVKEEPTSAWIVKYIFPGGYIPSLSEMVRELSRHDCVVMDVENLGQHYALTLDKWLENFEQNIKWVENKYGKEFVRMWRLYLQFSAAGFRKEDIYVHQILFCNGKPSDYPLTREFLYA